MNTGLALIARADNSGLATQSWEFWRHMKPERTLIVLHDHATRGECYFERYRGGPGEVRVTRMYPTTRDCAWIATNARWIFSAETAYSTKVWDHSRRAGAKVAIQANPELYDYERADRLLPATPWRLDVFEAAAHRGVDVQVVPVPCNRELLSHRPISEVQTFYHVNSIAMEDRNGTESVLSAANYMERESRILIRGGEPGQRRIGRAEVIWLGPHHGPYHEHWLEAVELGAQALVLPRRFGGLCLPIQEAASMGMPVICLNTDPYFEIVAPGLQVPGRVKKEAPMKGGMFRVHTCIPKTLGAAMDNLVSQPELAQTASARSHEWARRHSWPALMPTYEWLFR